MPCRWNRRMTDHSHSVFPRAQQSANWNYRCWFIAQSFLGFGCLFRRRCRLSVKSILSYKSSPAWYSPMATDSAAKYLPTACFESLTATSPWCLSSVLSRLKGTHGGGGRCRTPAPQLSSPSASWTDCQDHNCSAGFSRLDCAAEMRSLGRFDFGRNLWDCFGWSRRFSWSARCWNPWLTVLSCSGRSNSEQVMGTATSY